MPNATLSDAAVAGLRAIAHDLGAPMLVQRLAEPGATPDGDFVAAYRDGNAWPYAHVSSAADDVTDADVMRAGAAYHDMCDSGPIETFTPRFRDGLRRVLRADRRARVTATDPRVVAFLEAWTPETAAALADEVLRLRADAARLAAHGATLRSTIDAGMALPAPVFHCVGHCGQRVSAADHICVGCAFPEVPR